MKPSSQSKHAIPHRHETSVNAEVKRKIWSILQMVTDPEIPILSLEEMGILRDVTVIGNHVCVEITPTYSGCPAIDQMRTDIKAALQQHGYQHVTVELVLSPAWTTDWMSEETKEKLRDYGISPPCKTSEYQQANSALTFSAICPQCRSVNTQVLSPFGSTACKALWKCNDCLEPFDFFKPI